MACDSCQVPLNVEVELTGTELTCKTCCGNLRTFLPRLGYHRGFNGDGKHIFEYKTPLVCPYCGQRGIGVECFCNDDGGWYEVTQNKQSEEVFQLVPEQQELPILSFQPPLSS